MLLLQPKGLIWEQLKQFSKWCSADAEIIQSESGIESYLNYGLDE